MSTVTSTHNHRSHIVPYISCYYQSHSYPWISPQKNIEESCERAMDSWKWSDAKKKSKYTIELNNGRAAQMGILGLMVHEKIGDHNPYVLNAIFGAPVAFNQ